MSIIKVAKLAGVSHATVSRVINHRPNVSAESIKRVRQAMEKLSYVPSAKRRGPKPKESTGIHTGNIGMLFFSEAPALATSPVMAKTLHAAQNALAAKGFNLMLAQVAEDGNLPPNVINGQVDGLLLHGWPPTQEIQHKLTRYSACVWMLSQRRMRGYWGDRVSPDNFKIGALAAEYLIDRGHERIAVVAFDSAHLGFVTRTQGFEDTARQMNVPFITVKEDLKSVSGDNGSAGQDSALCGALVEQFLSAEGPMPTGLFIPRDIITIGMYRSLRAKGVMPGRDVDIISCDNTPALDALEIRPATIDVRPEEIGRRAVEQLLWRIGNHNAPMNVTAMVEPLLVQGDMVDFDSSPAASENLKD